MATIFAEHKFAVLFSGSTDSQYIADIQKVYETLTDYYNYPPNNIKVYIGTNDAAWSGLASIPFQIVNNIADFQHEYYNFVARSTTGHDPQDQAMSQAGINDWNTMMLYITGKIDDSGASPVLIFREADPSVTGDTDILLPILSSAIPPETDLSKILTGFYNFPPQGGDPVSSNYLDTTSLHIIWQTDKAYSFRDGLYNNVPAKCMSLTFACDASTLLTPVATGSAFTDAWINGLKMIPNGGGLFADEIDTLVEPTDNLLISTRKLCQYVHGNLNEFVEKIIASSPDDLMIGKPVLRILDGDEHSPPRGWWASPDIWITNTNHPDPDNDYYMYDIANDIHIRVHAEGCHPLRLVYIGAKVFRSGGGGGGERHTASFTPTLVIKPGEDMEYTYQYTFVTGYSHRCVKARAQLLPVTDAEIDDDPSNEWNPPARPYEAQRNTNPSPLKSSSGGAGEDTETGNANIDEEDPEEDTKPENDKPETDTDTKSTKNLRAAKEQIYVIKNIFRYSRDYRYRIDPVLLKMRKEIRSSWCRIDPEHPGKYQKLELIMEPYPHIALKLKSGEEAHIVNHIGFRKGFRPDKAIDIDFEIEMGYQKIKRFIFWRVLPLRRVKFVRFSGVTMRLFDSSFTLKGIVKDAKGVVMPETVVMAKTLNGRQSAACKSDKKGVFIFKDINPDIYMLSALIKGKASGTRIVHGMPSKKRDKDKAVEIVIK